MGKKMRKLTCLLLVLCGMSSITVKGQSKSPKHIIVVTAYGVGLQHLNLMHAASGGNVALNRFENQTFFNQHPLAGEKPDLAALSTALNSGKRTKAGSSAMDANGDSLSTFFREAGSLGYQRYLWSTGSLLGPTVMPHIAPFTKGMSKEEVAKRYLKSDIHKVFGAGEAFFNNRKDGKDLLRELKKNHDYKVKTRVGSFKRQRDKRFFGVEEGNYLPKAEDRKNLMPKAVLSAGSNLRGDDKILWVIDLPLNFPLQQMGKTEDVLAELDDFNETVGALLSLCKQYKNTLLVVVCLGENGQPVLKTMDVENRTAQVAWENGEMTPGVGMLYTYGPASDKFATVKDITDLNDLIRNLLR